jgi:membrane protein
MATLTDKVEDLLWSPALERLPAVPHLVVGLVRFVYAVLRDAVAGNLPLRAMGLVYITILSIVPLIAISFSVLKGFGFHKRMEPILYDLLRPLGQKGVELTSQVIGFVDNVQGNVLAFGGLALLFFTSLSMAQKVEGSLNFVWRVEQSRNLAQRFSEYLSVILVGPVVMVTAISLIGAVESNSMVQDLRGIQPIDQTFMMAGKLAPYVLVVAGFTFVYWFLPNTRVRFGPAFVGGLTGGLMWATSGFLFATFVANSARTMTIYSSFAIVVIALIWLYLCWLILLVGGQVAFYVQHPEHLRLGFKPVSLGGRQREAIALSVMSLVARRFRDGDERVHIRDVAGQLTLPNLALSAVVLRLEAAGLLSRTQKDELLPGRDPGHIQLREVLDAVREPQSTDIFPEGQWPDRVQHVADRVSSAITATLGNESLYDLLDASPLNQ